jgi:hypothetical protein
LNNFVGSLDITRQFFWCLTKQKLDRCTGRDRASKEKRNERHTLNRWSVVDGIDCGFDCRFCDPYNCQS